MSRPTRRGITDGERAAAILAGPEGRAAKARKETGPMTTLAKWKSHKIVRAGKVLKVSHTEGGPLLVEGLHGPVEVAPDPGLFARGAPSGDFFLVVYENEDGTEYQSWSPASTFLAGYNRIED